MSKKKPEPQEPKLYAVIRCGDGCFVFRNASGGEIRAVS